MLPRIPLCTFLLALLLNNLAAKSPMVLRIGNGTEPKGIDPQLVTGMPEHHIISELFEGLLSFDPRTLEPKPGLAYKWDITEDGLVYTFHLRSGLKWSDGEPITANDFVESYKRMLSPKLAAEYANMLYDFVAGAHAYYKGETTDFSQVGFKALDETTLEVRLNHRTPYLLQMIACHYSWYAVPTRLIARHGPLDSRNTDWTKPGKFAGSGPFMLKEWLPNQKIVVVRNPNYWDAANVRLDAIEFHAIEDTNTEERMFRSGQLDMTNELPISKIEVYRKKYPESLQSGPLLAVYFYRCNVTKPPLNDKRVRKALALAINREAIVKNVTRGGQIPAYSLSYPGTSGYFPRARLEGGLPEARRLLEQAGYAGGKGFPSIALLYNTHDGHRAIAEAVQAMWRTALGIDITLQNQEWAVYQDSQHSMNYQIARAGWVADYVDPNTFLEIWVTGKGNNDTGWSNPDYDQLYQQSLAAKTDAERFEIYQKMEAILMEECPIIPVYHYTRHFAMNPKVKGIYPNLLDQHPCKHAWIEE